MRKNTKKKMIQGSIIAVLWVSSLIVVAFVCWKVAPSEKIIYKDKPTRKCDIEAKDVGFINWGYYEGKKATVEAVDKDCAGMFVKLEMGHTIQIEDTDNWTPAPEGLK